MHAETNTHQTFKPEWFSKLNRIQNRFEFPKPLHLGLRPVPGLKPNPVRNSVPNRGIESGHGLLVCNDSDGFPEAIVNYVQTNIIKRARRSRGLESKHVRRARRSRALVSRKESSTQSSSRIPKRLLNNQPLASGSLTVVQGTGHALPLDAAFIRPRRRTGVHWTGLRNRSSAFWMDQ
jgi:hypothetical protein